MKVLSLAQWKVLVAKPTKNPPVTASTKPKGKAKAVPSTKTNSSDANMRKAAACTQASGSSTIPKRSRRKTTVPRENV
jgi:hypothetical protein